MEIIRLNLDEASVLKEKIIKTPAENFKEKMFNFSLEEKLLLIFITIRILNNPFTSNEVEKILKAEAGYTEEQIEDRTIKELVEGLQFLDDKQINKILEELILLSMLSNQILEKERDG